MSQILAVFSDPYVTKKFMPNAKHILFIWKSVKYSIKDEFFILGLKKLIVSNTGITFNNYTTMSIHSEEDLKLSIFSDFFLSLGYKPRCNYFIVVVYE